MLCVNNLVMSDKLTLKINVKSVSANIFNLVFKEAIFCGEFSLIAYLISIWPSHYLKLSELISNEIIDSDSLSKPLFSTGPTILDYVLLGILISRPCSRLRTMDFIEVYLFLTCMINKIFFFESFYYQKDLKLTKEISHLCLLWMKPENRNYQNIHEKIKTRCCKNSKFR